MNHIEAYPLSWPEGWERTERRVSSQFSTSIANASVGIIDEIRLMGGTSPLISSNLRPRRDGSLYASQKRPDDPGVAVYFALKGEPKCFACDRFDRVQDNLQAIRKTIEALRGIERWGSSEILTRVFQGFAALPDTERSWWEVLGITDRHWSLEQIEARYKSLSKVHHPDRGGTTEKMAELNRAIAQARAKKRAGHG